MSRPDPWVLALFRWLMSAGLAAALGGVAGRGLARRHAVTAPLSVLTPLRAPIRSLGYQDRTSQR